MDRQQIPSNADFDLAGIRALGLRCGWDLVRFLDRNFFYGFGLLRTGLSFGGLNFLPHRRQLGRSGLQLFQLVEDHASLFGHRVREVEAKLFDGFGDSLGSGWIGFRVWSGSFLGERSCFRFIRDLRLPIRRRYQFHSPVPPVQNEPQIRWTPGTVEDAAV